MARLQRRPLFALTAIALAPIGAAAWQACAVYDASLLLPAEDASDAPIDVAPDAADADTCAHARWPDRPAADDPSTTPDLAIVDALDSLDIGLEGDAGSDVGNGYDLDGVCTCPGPESCTPAAGAATHCDDREGRDDSGGALLRALGAFHLVDQATIDQRLHDGFYGLVVAVRGYDGQPNDTNVTVGVYISNGLVASEDGGAFPPAKHDGTDRWTVDPGSLLAGASALGADCEKDEKACAPLFFDGQAYVAGGVLVAHLDFPLSLGSGSVMGAIVISLTGSVVTAKLTKTQTAVGPSFRLDDGHMAGRWPTRKLLSSLAVLTDPVSSRPMCGDDPTYQGVKSRICAAADVTSDPKTDNTAARCDALSVALRFTAGPARLGDVYTAGTTKSGCADAGPFTDDCP